MTGGQWPDFLLRLLGMGVRADSRGANKFAEAVVTSPAKPAPQTSRFAPPLSSALNPKKMLTKGTHRRN
jgi:hypothetical protein